MKDEGKDELPAADCRLPTADRQLIVNADDFGLTAGVNRAIVEAHTRGIVTSATIMANMPGFAEAVALAQAHPTLGVGLHFNLTQGYPVAAANDVMSLLNARGEFLGTSKALAWRAWRGQVQAAHVVNELRAQLEQAIGAGLRLTHVDSHQHAHALPLVWRALVEVLPTYDIHCVRRPRERFSTNGLTFNPKRIKQSLTSVALARLSGAHQLGALHTTDSFLGLAQTGYWTKAWLLESLRHLPAGVTELMCHPGYEDEALQTVATRLRASRALELRLLTDPEIMAALQSYDIHLVRFGVD